MVIEVSITEVLDKALKKAYESGLELGKQGSLILDESMVFHKLSRALEVYGVVYTSIRDAVERYPDIVEKYMITGIDLDKVDNGVLLYVPRDTRIVDPVYTCYTIARKGVVQRVYNLIVLRENAEAVAITGCMSLVPEGVHSSNTDTFLDRNARLYKVMIHNWLPGIRIGSLKKAYLMDNSFYHDYYINITPPHNMGFKIELYLKGRGSTALSNTILVGRDNSRLSYETIAYLDGEESSVELLSRMLGEDNSRIYSRSAIIARADYTRGHIECQGLQLSSNSVLSTTPILESHVENTRLTHEASIGRISEEELEYLMSHGFREDEAVSIIVRGFLEHGLDRVPERIRLLIRQTLDRLVSSSM